MDVRKQMSWVFFILAFDSSFTYKGIWNKLQDCKAVTQINILRHKKIHNGLIITILNYTLSQFTIMPFLNAYWSSPDIPKTSKKSKDSFENR